MEYYYRFRFAIDMTEPIARSCLEQFNNVIEFNKRKPIPGEKYTYGLPLSKYIDALSSASCFEEIYFKTNRVMTEFTWFECDVEEDAIEDWLRLKEMPISI